MRRCSRLVLASLALATLLPACGGDGGAPSTPDAGGPGGDAGAPYCVMQLSLTSSEAFAPTTVEATATIESQSLSGQQRFSWDVRLGDGTPVPFTPQTPDERRLTFTAIDPSVYLVSLDGSMDDIPCTPAFQTVTVTLEGAEMIPYRLRFVPAPGQPAVIHERTETLNTGAENYIGRITLSSGIPVAGQIHTADGEPVAAYVRATRSDAAPVEAFADATGSFSMRLDSGSYDVLVVPASADLAPFRFPAQPIATTWSLTLPAARLATGTVLDRANLPLANARIALQIDGAPAAVTTTDDQGAFAVPVSPGSAAALLVIPPAESGLPWLELDDSPALATALAAGTPLAIAYAPGLAVHAIAPTARDASGASLAGVRATWIARSIDVPGDAPAPGTLTAGGESPLALPLTGTMRVTATSRPDGTWPELRLPAAAYDVVLEPGDDTAAGGVTVLLASVDGDSSVDALALTQPALVHGKIVSLAGEDLGQIQVTATPRGLLASSPAAGAATITASDGTFTLALAPDAEYEISLDSAARRHGRTRITVTAPPAGQSLDLASITLSAAVRLIGDVAITNGAGGAAGVTVLLSCLDCDFATPLAEAVTDSTGAFVLAVPVAPSVPAP